VTTDATRAAVIGCGFIGTRHLRNLAAWDDVAVVAVADPDAARAAAAAGAAGARAYTDPAELIAREALDAVWICVPPFAHGEPERAAADRGLPFFVEKPLAADLGTAERIAAAVADADLLTSVGYHWRYLDTVAAARALLRSSPARLALGFWLDATPPPAWWHVERTSGGQLVEQATHLFDLVRVLVGEPSAVFGAGCRCERAAWPDADILEVSSATLRIGCDAVATISATCILDAPHRIGLQLVAEGVAIDLTEDEMTVDRGGRRQTRRVDVDPFHAEDRAFVDAVQGRPANVRAPYADALATHRLVAAAARSARSGELIELPGAALA
jgi:predicted dehydrogenase